MRIAVVFVLGLVTAGAMRGAADVSLSVHEIPAPANLHALSPTLSVAPDGAVWMAWVESGTGPVARGNTQPEHAASPSVANALRAARYDAELNRFTAAHTIVSDSAVAASPADCPQLVADAAGDLYSVWTDGHGGAWLSTSPDHGVTWKRPRPWSSGGNAVEKFSLVRLADGRVLAAWLDDRRRTTGGPKALFTRIIGGPDASDRLVDDSVCDCCQTSLVAFLDDGALLAYRGRTAENVRDIDVARFKHGAWMPARVLNNDDWRITACPVNGPSLATDGSRVAASWFTAAGNEPRVLASFSPDAGARWLMPLRVDHGHPVGHVATVLLRDGAFVVVWMENDGSVWLRRISPDYAVTEPMQLAKPGEASVRSFPRAALARDYAGEHTTAVLLVAYTRAAGGIRTVRIDVPEGDLVSAERNCNCAPTLRELEGFPIRGTPTALDASNHSVQARHGEVPGVFDPGMHVFAVDPEEFASLRPDRPFLGRVEWKAGAWHLFDVRLLAPPAK